jgi:hypothetical protein
MLRLGRSRTSAAPGGDSDVRLDRALAAREEAELALAAASVAKKELEAKVAELEGAPARLEHEARGRALTSAQARLQSVRESAAHEQTVLKDLVLERERSIEQLEYRLRSVDHMSGEHGAAAKRLQSELDAARLSLAEERKARYVSEDRLRVAEGRGTSEAGMRAYAAEQEAARLQAQSQSREVEMGRLRSQLDAASADRAALRQQLDDATKASGDREANLAEARTQLELLHEALQPSGSGAAAGEAGPSVSVESLSSLARALQERAAHADGLAEAAAASDAAAARAQAEATASEKRLVTVEEQLAAERRALQLAQSALNEAKREAAVPVLGARAELQQRDERIFELTAHTLPALEQERSDALARLARTEARVDTERQAKSEARADAERARQAFKTAEDTVAVAKATAEAAERAAMAATEKANALTERCSALELQVESARQKEKAYSLRETEVAEKVETSDVRSSLLEEQARLLTTALQEEEAKLGARDEMLRALQQELASQRKRNVEREQRAALAAHGEKRAEASRREAEAERDELHEKLSLAMMEVNARAERLEHSQAQVSASRGEIRALENQLAIATSQLTLTQQKNTSLVEADASKGAQLASAVASLKGREERLEASEAAAAEARRESGERHAELVRVSEQLGAAAEERDLFEQQLTASRHRLELLTAELEMATRSERTAKADARD